MTERSDITVDWGLSPRLIEVALPSVELSNQDLHDTLNSNTLQPGQADDSLENMDDDFIIDSAGKEDLGGGVEVGITSTLLDGQIAFGRTNPRSTTTETITTGGTNSVICSGANFTGDNVARGDWVLNWTDLSVTEVLDVISATELRVRTPTGLAASSNDFAVNDVITVWEVAECELLGGNTVAVDTVPASINPLFTTFGRFATKASASQATTSNQESLNFAVYQNQVQIDKANATGLAALGTDFPAGTGKQPCLQLGDGQTVAVANGITVLHFRSDHIFNGADVLAGYTLLGEGPTATLMTFPAGVNTVNSNFKDARLTGDIGGAVTITDCWIDALTDVGNAQQETDIVRCLFLPGTVIALSNGANNDLVFRDCDSGSPGDTPVIFDWNGAQAGGIFRKYSGGIRFQNVDKGNEITIDGDCHVTIDPSCTDINLVIRGDVKVTDNRATKTPAIIDQGTYTKLLELWSRLGLNPDEPMTTNDDNSVTVGSITIGAVNGATDTVQTRTGDSL